MEKGCSFTLFILILLLFGILIITAFNYQYQKQFPKQSTFSEIMIEKVQ